MALILFFCGLPVGRLHADERAIVIHPVVDVWMTPESSTAALTDDRRQTQLLFGETVIVHASSENWTQVEIPDQPRFRSHSRWEGYPGWVLTSDLAVSTAPIGSRAAIVDNARALIGAPYLWGGLTTRGADCSGLVYLVYRLNGYRIPRDSFDQWIKSRRIARRLLKPADLIFSAKPENPKKVTHVALYAGHGMMIEAPQSGVAAREILFKEKFGKELTDVESGDTVGDHVIYFGRCLKQ